MQPQEQDVKSKSDVVGIAKYPKYDNVAEAQEGMGDGKLLEMINAQIRTNAMNEVRNAAVGRPSKKKLLRKARASITAEEFGAVAGDPDKIDDLIALKAQELLDSGQAEDD